MLIQELIERKRRGGSIDRREWSSLVRASGAGELAQESLSALVTEMADSGIDTAEIAGIADALSAAALRLDLSGLGAPAVTMQTTGGVGNKVPLVVAPLVASTGVVVPILVGHGTGHTAGTFEKMASIPGFTPLRSHAAIRRQLATLHCAFFDEPDDSGGGRQIIQALQATGAARESVALACAALMSMTLSAGLSGVVLDVARGSGAEVQELDRALELATMMMQTSVARGCPSVALITAMDRPIGRAVGNALEVEEAIHTLAGEGPADLMELSYAIGAEMVVLAGRAPDEGAARRLLEHAISSGRATKTFAAVIAAQGGNAGVVEDPAALPQAEACELFVAYRAGIVAEVRPRPVGRGVVAMGGPSSDPAAGFVITARIGDWVEQGEPLATIFARNPDAIATGRAALTAAIVIGDEAEHPLAVVSHRIDAAGAASYSQRPETE